jgi:hypothetical protein
MNLPKNLHANEMNLPKKSPRQRPCQWNEFPKKIPTATSMPMKWISQKIPMATPWFMPQKIPTATSMPINLNLSKSWFKKNYWPLIPGIGKFPVNADGIGDELIESVIFPPLGYDFFLSVSEVFGFEWFPHFPRGQLPWHLQHWDQIRFQVVRVNGIVVVVAFESLRLQSVALGNNNVVVAAVEFTVGYEQDYDESQRNQQQQQLPTAAGEQVGHGFLEGCVREEGDFD